MPRPTGPLRIVQLTAENVKRLRAVDVTPDGSAAVVEITGRNAQGKTSLLDAIWLALGGPAAGRAIGNPVRDGETTAEVRLDLGDLIVTRTWNTELKSPTSLRVENREGARYPSPQAVLDELVGRLSFDPLAFAGLPAKDQVATLLDLVVLPFDPVELAYERGMAFDRRTEINRDLTRAAAALDLAPKVPDGTPAEPVRLADLVAARDRAHTALAARVEAEADVRDAARARSAASTRLAAAEAAITAAQRAADEAFREEHEAIAAEDATRDALALQPSEEFLTGQVAGAVAALDEVEAVNEAVRARDARLALASQVGDLTAQVAAWTDKIRDLDERKRQGLAAATMPIDGLAFDDQGVTYNGVPFAQCSSAERIRVSLAMAMALNPTLRVIRVFDGSLLDSVNRAAVEAMCAEHGYQVWIETVDSGAPAAVVIEDGSVVGS